MKERMNRKNVEETKKLMNRGYEKMRSLYSVFEEIEKNGITSPEMLVGTQLYEDLGRSLNNHVRGRVFGPKNVELCNEIFDRSQKSMNGCDEEDFIQDICLHFFCNISNVFAVDGAGKMTAYVNEMIDKWALERERSLKAEKRKKILGSIETPIGDEEDTTLDEIIRDPGEDTEDACKIRANVTSYEEKLSDIFSDDADELLVAAAGKLLDETPSEIAEDLIRFKSVQATLAEYENWICEQYRCDPDMHFLHATVHPDGLNREIELCNGDVKHLVKSVYVVKRRVERRLKQI